MRWECRVCSENRTSIDALYGKQQEDRAVKEMGTEDPEG